jgi:Sulfatase
MSSHDKVQRLILPIPDAQHVGVTTYDAKDPDTKFPPIEPLRPPKSAPNVLIVLIDDCGFGATSAFGGPIPTPSAERLAKGGLKLTRFHTTALCSPTRQHTSVLPKNKAPLAMTLKLNGYSTAQFGKCHEVPVWETSPLGHFGQWPTGGGSEYFYGFIQRLFVIEATKYSVLPLDDRTFERFNPDLAGRPQLIKSNSQLLFGGMSRLSEGSLVVTHNKSYSLTAEIEVPASGASGVIVALGGGVGGWSLYALNGKLKHCYNFFGIERYYAEGSKSIPPGKHQVRMEFRYDGGGIAKGGTVSLYVDGKKDGEGRVDQTVRCCSPPTRPATSGRKPARPSHRNMVLPTTSSAAR